MQLFYENFKKFKNYYLFYIAKHENSSIFSKEMFFHPKLINQKNSQEETLAHLLCYEGMIEKYIPFLDLGGENTLTIQGNSVLHYSISSGSDVFLMIELINKGQNPLLKNKNGQTPLHMLNNIQATSFFINWNFRTFSKIEKLTDNEGNSIAHSAAINKYYDVANYLCREFPTLNTLKNKNGLTVEQIIFLNKHPFINNSYNNDFLKEDIFDFNLFLDNENYIKFTYANNNVLLNIINYLTGESKELSTSNFNLKRNHLTQFEKLKPLSLQILKYEAKERFSESMVYKDEFYEMYKETIIQRNNDTDHNFKFN